MRGTDKCTVQQLMNFIGEKISKIDLGFPEQHRALGSVFMDYTPESYAVQSRVDKIKSAQGIRRQLETVLSDIETQCGEWHDYQQKEQS